MKISLVNSHNSSDFVNNEMKCPGVCNTPSNINSGESNKGLNSSHISPKAQSFNSLL